MKLFKGIDLLKRAAALSVEDFPQYAGHFDDYVVVKINVRVKTKAGTAFERGEWTLATPESAAYDSTSNEPKAKTRKFVTVWSFKNQVDTSIPLSKVEYV